MKIRGITVKGDVLGFCPLDRGYVIVLTIVENNFSPFYLYVLIFFLLPKISSYLVDFRSCNCAVPMRALSELACGILMSTTSGEGCSCSCDHVKVKSTPSIGLGWEFDNNLECH